jgi:hypothetical protein
MNLKWDAVDQYFSGQGVVLVGLRDSLGRPKGLRSMGNVSALKITTATSVLEHKESHTGQRGTDKRITTEVKVGLSMTGENFSGRNLADFTRGLLTEVAAGTETAYAVVAYPGLVSPLGHVGVTVSAVKTGATSLTGWVDDDTAWDYKVNEDHGSIKFNDGVDTAYSANWGAIVTAITVGATTVITCDPGTLAVGDVVTCSGFTGADAANLNAIALTVSAVSGTGFSSTTVDTTGDTITTAAGTRAVFATAGHSYTVAYTYLDQELIGALSQGTLELYMRFEGLNTAEESEAVVVEVFKCSTDPLKDFDMISDGIQAFVLEGSVLADTLRASGSQYFRVMKLDSAPQPA